MGEVENSFAEFSKDFIAGGVAATIGKSVVAPVERIKLILQVQDILSKKGQDHKRFKGMGDVFIKITRQEGFFSLWRGNLASVAKYFPLQAFSFSFYDLFGKYFLRGVDKNNEPKRFFFMNFLSGGFAGVVSMAIVYPLDFARTRLATDMGSAKREFNGVRDCLQKVFKREGISGLYKGFVVSAQGLFIYRAIYFALYDSAKESFLDKYRNYVITFFTAQWITVLAGIISYPFDTVRRRMMMQAGLKKQDQIYKNTLHCWVHTFQNGGIAAFFRGSLANVVRATGGAVTLILFDEIKLLMEDF